MGGRGGIIYWWFQSRIAILHYFGNGYVMLKGVEGRRVKQIMTRGERGQGRAQDFLVGVRHSKRGGGRKGQANNNEGREGAGPFAGFSCGGGGG